MRSHLSLPFVLLQFFWFVILTLLMIYTVMVLPDWTLGNPSAFLGLVIVALGMVSILLLRNRHGSLWQRAGFPVLTILGMTCLLIPYESGFVTVVIYTLCLVLMMLLMWGLRTREQALNLAAMTSSVLFIMIVVQFLTPPIIQTIYNNQKQKVLDQFQMDARANAASQNLNPTLPKIQLDRPEFKTKFVEGAQQESPWTVFTGIGTSINTRMNYSREGVFDVDVDYNAQGYRGPEIPYEKPDDVYRIMFLGDSFIEAMQVVYEDTLYAQLAELLKTAHTPDGKRIQVMAVGTTGWSTAQAYLYYHHEGYKYKPDLVVHFFIINDVSDNNPSAFNLGRKFDFEVTDDDIQLLSLDKQTNAYNGVAKWINFLPLGVRDLGLFAIMRQALVPPREILAVAANVTNPQWYIFLRASQIDGYAEAWRRTEQSYKLLNRDVTQSEGRLMVFYVDPGLDYLERATGAGEKDDAWLAWDINFPRERLQSFLPALNVSLVWPDQTYTECATRKGGTPYGVIYYVGDGHWTPLGHRVTAGLIAEALYDDGSLDESNRPSREALLGCF